MAADQRFAAALRALAGALEEIPALSMIIGGIAVIAAGVPRETVDIDATVLGATSDLDQVIAAFAGHGIVPRIPDAVQFARDRRVLLLLHESSGVPIDVSFAWFAFEEEALAHAREAEIGGSIVRIARPEDLIVYKAAAWRDRDRSDIERLLALHWRGIDLERVRRLIAEIASALDDPARLDAFERILERAQRS